VQRRKEENEKEGGLMRIPDAFVHPLYYKKTDTLSITSFELEDIITKPFKYDIAYYQGAAPFQLPWENTSDSIPLLLFSWKRQESMLNDLHEKRRRFEAKEHIIPAVGWFIQMLFWINGQPVRSLTDWKKDVQSLQWKPMNVDERLDFVMKKPGMYHAFIQLQQLFTECNKLFYKIKVMEMKKADKKL
jgi:hypothetical protein